MKQIAADIKSGNYKKAYLLYGSESYLRELYLKNLLKGLGAADGDMNFTRFSGKGLKDDDVISISETMPFFADRRIVLLDQTDLFKEKHEALEAYLGKLPDYLTLIIVEDSVDKRSKLYKAVSSVGYAAEFKELEEKDITAFVVQKLAKEKKKIRKNTCELFLSGAGNDLNNISNELEKLISYVGERDVITDDDVSAICSPVIENKIFEMVNAVAAGDRKKALDRYNDLLILKEQPMRILFLLARQFDQLLHIRELSKEGLGSAAIASKLGLNPYVVKKSIPAASRYSIEDLKAAVEDMVKSEEDVKTGRLDEGLSVELIIMKYSK